MRTKRSLAVIAIVLSVGLFAQAQNVSPEDREKAMKYLESTRQGVVDATKGLSEKQWNFKAAPDKWSIAECAEHITLAEDFIRSAYEKTMKEPAASEEQKAKANIPDEKLVAMLSQEDEELAALRHEFEELLLSFAAGDRRIPALHGHLP